MDFVEVKTINDRIQIDIKYASEDNFTKQEVYPAKYRNTCFLRREIAEKLSLVQQDLEKEGYSLKIFDAYRPLSIQYKFWELTPNSNYVANPFPSSPEDTTFGSKLNRGCAVDLTIIRLSDGQEVKMPSPFDDFTDKAHRDYDKMTEEESFNCSLLENAMKKHDFLPFYYEWWHFDVAHFAKYPLSDLSFDEIHSQINQ